MIYVLQKTQIQKLFLNSKMKNYFVVSVGANYTKMERQKMVFKNISVANERQQYQKHQIQ